MADISITVPDGSFTGYLAKPAKTPAPGSSRAASAGLPVVWMRPHDHCLPP